MPEEGERPIPQVGVLVVEDHRMFAEALCDALDAYNVTVLAKAATMAEAVTLAGQLRPEVVVMDYILPDGDGITAARLIRAVSPTSRVVMLTGSGDERILVRAIKAGCASYVSKAQAIGDLAAAIRAARAGTTIISPTALQRLVRQLGGGTPWVGTQLSAREVEILQLVAGGDANREIAAQLRLSPHTVRNHVHNVLSKLGAHSKLEAVAMAQREGILEPPPRRTGDEPTDPRARRPVGGRG